MGIWEYTFTFGHHDHTVQTFKINNKQEHLSDMNSGISEKVLNYLSLLLFLSFIYSFLQLYPAQGGSGPGAYPKNTGYGVGLHPECDTSSGSNPGPWSFEAATLRAATPFHPYCTFCTVNNLRSLKSQY